MLAISSPQLAQKTIPSSEGLLLLARSVFTKGFYASVISSFPEWWVFVKIRELRNQVRGLVNSNKWRWRVRARCLVLLRVRPFTGAGQLVSRLAGTHWVLQRNGVGNCCWLICSRLYRRVSFAILSRSAFHTRR